MTLTLGRLFLLLALVIAPSVGDGGYLKGSYGLISKSNEVQENKHHYGNPADGCLQDEMIVRIQGVPGSICSPECTNEACPKDLPEGSSATPTCAVSDAKSGRKFCVLLCQRSSDCGAGSSCEVIGMLGICTFGREQFSKILFDDAMSPSQDFSLSL